MTEDPQPRGPKDRGIALITGASGGLGAAVARRLAADGYGLALTYRSSREAAERLKEELEGVPVELFELDAGDRGRPKPLVREVEERLGDLSVLVNNLGFHEGRLLALTSDDLWDRTLDVNLGAAFRLCRSVVPGMVRRRGGAIVNISSLSALRGVAGESAYGAAKAGLLSLTRALAREVGKRGVRVNAVVPGFVPTAMTSDLDEEQIAALRSGECLPGPTTADDVAGAVAFLISEDARAVTGQCLAVDSGVSC